MRVYVLGSGSSGNALLVEARGTRILVEAGVGPRVLTSRLAELGLALGPGDLHGIVPTHEHGDHYGHAHPLAVAFGAPLYLHPGIGAPASRRRPSRVPDAPPNSFAPPGSGPGSGPPSSDPQPSAPGPIEIRRYAIGSAVTIGALTISTVQVPHDAMQIAIRVDDGVRAFGVATDVGRLTNPLVGLLAACDAALVEANHCSEMLAFSEYPECVKRRVSGGLGHLSNDQTAELAARLAGSRLARMWLGHLSRSNNSPARALEVVQARARRIDVAVLPGASPVALDVRSTRPHQLGLPFG